jgi:hypothetical protein
MSDEMAHGSLDTVGHDGQAYYQTACHHFRDSGAPSRLEVLKE